MTISQENPKKGRMARDSNRVKKVRNGAPRTEDHAINGPKPKYTAAQLIEAYSRHLNIAKACKEVGCNLNVHYGWLNTNPEYAAAYDQARFAISDRAEAVINDATMHAIDITDLKNELMESPITGPHPDDTPEQTEAKIRVRRARLKEAQEWNRDALETSKFIVKLRGHKSGWKDKVETEITASDSLASFIASTSRNRQAKNKDTRTPTQAPSNDNPDTDAPVLPRRSK